ncbi:unnamed protein product [Amoebophrya sp. A25]|nr:unnamed protein product [Amoebophrya sp. A25]|eukprot:GSA25T00005796001.1
MAEEEPVETGPAYAVPLVEDVVFPLREEILTAAYEGTTTAEAKFRAGLEKDAAKAAEEEGGDGLAVPEKNLTFGEISFKNLFDLLNLCKSKTEIYPAETVVVDCGSGLGKQVIGAALLDSWLKVCGVELLESYDTMAQAALEKFKAGVETMDESVPRCADVALQKGNFVDEVAGLCGENAAIVCALSPVFQADQLTALCTALQGLKMGSLLITMTRAAPDVEYWNPICVQKMECPWGTATVFIHSKFKMPPVEE